MGLTRIAALVALIGAVLMIAGATVRFGPWALMISGVVVLVLAVAVDWEKVS